MRAKVWILGLSATVAVGALAMPAGTRADGDEPSVTEALISDDPVPAALISDDPVPAAPADVDGGDMAFRGSPLQVTPTLPPPAPTTVAPTPPPIDPEELPWFSGTGRRVVYSLSAMRVWAVEADGRVANTYRVSGKRGVPNPGTYSVWSRSLHTHNIEDPQVRWMYMIRFAKGPGGGNIGFHEIPTRCQVWTSNTTGRNCRLLQTEAQLGQALSGGCIRQARADAQWLWNWAGIGTRVVVLA